jgi:hypothetical protein
MYEALSHTFPENPTSVGHPVEALKGPVIIYPNPSEGWITIKTIGPFTVSIFNSLGRCIHQGYCDLDQVEIDLNPHPPGIYLVRVINMTGISFQRFILR